jgi:hypothetical protein
MYSGLGMLGYESYSSYDLMWFDVIWFNIKLYRFN